MQSRSAAARRRLRVLCVRLRLRRFEPLQRQSARQRRRRLRRSPSDQRRRWLRALPGWRRWREQAQRISSSRRPRPPSGMSGTPETIAPHPCRPSHRHRHGFSRRVARSTPYHSRFSRCQHAVPSPLSPTSRSSRLRRLLADAVVDPAVGGAEGRKNHDPERP